ncbi:DUF2764 family protein [Puteibacter caeruleilacunae]|nr:DUF2764 family protein [Puteibacter caeruleilacunae]
MSNVVYLMCSLPSLTFDKVPPISLDEFNSDAKSQLSSRHFRLLELVELGKINSEKKAGLKSIAEMLADVQQDISEIRSAKAQNRQPQMAKLPKSLSALNPLEREKLILQWQWEELDSIESGKTFTLTEVMVYKLKLQILNRLHSFDEKKGAQILASVVNPSKKEKDDGRSEN